MMKGNGKIRLWPSMFALASLLCAEAGQGPAAPSVAHAATTVSGGETKTIDNNQQSERFCLNGSNIKFTVTATGTVRSIWGPFTDADISNNEVYIYGTVIEGTFGGNSRSGKSNIFKNKVTIAGGNVAGVNGAVADAGEAYENEVFFNNGTGSIGIDGGYSSQNTANHNTVTIQGSSTKINYIKNNDYIDQICGGKAGKDANFNTLTILDGTISHQHIYGGYGSSLTYNLPGNANNNAVIIAGGTIKGNDIHIAGGCSLRNNADYNTVTVTGGTIESGPIYGGKGKVRANNNVVTIGGGTFSHAAPAIYGADAAAANDNVVNLTGATTGLDNASFTNRFTDSGTGNELHVGGTKTYDEDGAPVIAAGAAWQGKNSANVLTNTVASVSNFDTIALHSVAWSTSVPALNAANVSHVGTLDITGMTIGGQPVAGASMTLLSSAADLSADGVGIGLRYKDESTIKTATSAQLGSGVTFGNLFEEAVADNLTFSGKLFDRARLVDKKAVVYTFGYNKSVGRMELTGTLALNDGARYDASGKGFSFDGNTEIDAGSLSFTSTGALARGDSLPLVTNAAGITASNTVTGGTGRQASLTVTDKGIVYGAVGNGSVKAAAGAVNYDVEGVTLETVDLAGWNAKDTSVVLSGKDGWSAKTGGVSVTGSVAVHDLAVGDSRDILQASDGIFSNAEIAEAIRYRNNEHANSAMDGVTLSGVTTGGVKASADGGALTYYATAQTVEDVILGEMSWGRGRTAEPGFDFRNVGTVTATDLAFTFTDAQKAALSKDSKMMLLSNATNLAADIDVTGKDKTQTIDYSTANGTALTGTLKGTVSTSAGAVNYQASGMTLDSVDVAGWDGKKASAVPTGWTASGDGIAVATEGMTNLPEATTTILTGGDFSKVTVGGPNQYKAADFTDGPQGVTLSGTQMKGVTVNEAEQALVYRVDNKNVEKISLGATDFEKGATLLDRSGSRYDYTGADLETAGFSVSFAKPEAVAAEDSMTLLKANETLKDFAAQMKTSEYSFIPATGVMMKGVINSSLAKNGHTVSYTATENRATKLTFTDVRWMTDSPLLTRPANIVFTGAAVDTSKISFTNINSLAAGDKMVLVADFGTSVGTVTGTAFSVGTLTGTGEVVLENSDLLYRVTKGTEGDKPKPEPEPKPEPKPEPEAEMRHNALMGTEVSMATLAAGNDFIGSATEGLSLTANVGADGVSTFAQMGGGTMRQETGSHVDTHTWNAIIALGHKNEKEKSTTQYGVFFEYGTGNYTTHNDGERGDGSTRYTGGGVLAKWTAKHGFYVEGSLRAGTVKDDARNVLRDGLGNPYSYETSAGYFGAHIGIGREIEVSGGNTVDVYAKYFHNRRNGVSFDAGPDRYDLDAVTSSVLRLGARYTMKREKWNFYGGLAYEHELDGKAGGRANGVPIRGADIGGGSARAEIGATITPDNSPWSLDLNLTGFAGKKRGLTGGVSIGFAF